MIAGHSHLDNTIRWVYCADSMDSPLTTLNWIMGHELVVLSGSSIAGDGDLDTIIIEYIKRCAKKRVAGVVINLGKYIPQLPEEAIREANRLSLPLMTVPWETRFVEFTKTICTAIVEQAIRDESNDLLANELLFGEFPLSGNAQLLLEQTGFDRSPGYVVALCRVMRRDHTAAVKQSEQRTAFSEQLQSACYSKNIPVLQKSLVTASSQSCTKMTSANLPCPCFPALSAICSAAIPPFPAALGSDASVIRFVRSPKAIKVHSGS